MLFNFVLSGSISALVLLEQNTRGMPFFRRTWMEGSADSKEYVVWSSRLPSRSEKTRRGLWLEVFSSINGVILSFSAIASESLSSLLNLVKHLYRVRTLVTPYLSDFSANGNNTHRELDSLGIGEAGCSYKYTRTLGAADYVLQ